MKAEEIHGSHELQESDDASYPHYGIYCKICSYMTCIFCNLGEGLDDEELSQPCIGESWVEELRRNQLWEVTKLKFDF